MIDQVRWLVLNAAYMMDTVGNRAAKAEIAMIKVAAPTMTLKVLDWAIQMHGAGGVSDDFPLAALVGRRAYFAAGGWAGRSASRTDRQAGAVALSAEGGRMPSDREIKLGSRPGRRAFQILAAAMRCTNLIAPATNLFYNAEVSARRYPEQAVPGVTTIRR